LDSSDLHHSLAAPRARSSRGRLGAFYVALVLLVAAAVVAVVAGAGSAKSQAAIAGGYDITAGSDCLGPQLEVLQSGQFVSLAATEPKVAGKLRLRDGVLRGKVTCRDGGPVQLVAKPGDRALAGKLGTARFAAALKRDPPPAGTARPRVPDNVAGDYALTPPSACLPTKIALEGSASDVTIAAGGRDIGRATYAAGKLAGRVDCKEGAPATLEGTATGRRMDVHLTRASTPPERLTADKQREFGKTLGVFFVAVAIVMLLARLFGMLVVRIGQPRVMGEVVAGIALGPTILGAALPDVETGLFPTDIIPVIGVVANLGLIFYMFLVGLELDLGQLRGRVTQAAAISNASVALPMALGLTLAIPVYSLLAPPTRFAGFALFMGVAMSITAFPVLARILVERRMLKRPIGVLVLGAAAVDDVTAWFLIALATAVATAGSGSAVLGTIGLAIAFCIVMAFAVRPLLARMSVAYDEAGHVPGGWIAAIFAGVLLSAYTTEAIGIALIFGAFVMGLVMPRHAGLSEEVTGRIEDFVVTLLLPLFFAFTGLRTNVGLLDRPILWALTGAILVVAVAGKLIGATIAAWVTGIRGRAATAIGVLMNTRGLTELIVLNLALDKGVISPALFAMLVIMALVTTFMAGPLLARIDPENALGAPVSEELDDARSRTIMQFPQLVLPDKSILVAAQSDEGLRRLVPVGAKLAHAEPPRELIVARLVQPPEGAAIRGAIGTEAMLLENTTREVEAIRDELVRDGVPARGVAFVSADPGGDVANVTEREQVDLVLIDGRRPLRGGAVPRGEIQRVLEDAPSDVAVLVAREDGAVLPEPGGGAIVVPFGGGDHDWAALELGAWLAAATEVPLRLCGAAREEDVPRVQRLVDDAAALVRVYAGVETDCTVIRPGLAGLTRGVQGASMLMMGLSERWRDEGIGDVRAELANATTVPLIFVRRGLRAGALAPAGDVTRFTWSRASITS
jgi:Kef-type K+ transport system membrane component KefB